MGLPTLSLCHGPTALRSAALGGAFPYNGYTTCVFPDTADDSSPSFGYLPGHLKPEDKVEAHLKTLGMTIKNTQMDNTTHEDRELITGASQLAAQAFSELAVE